MCSLFTHPPLFLPTTHSFSQISHSLTLYITSLNLSDRYLKNKDLAGVYWGIIACLISLHSCTEEFLQRNTEEKAPAPKAKFKCGLCPKVRCREPVSKIFFEIFYPLASALPHRSASKLQTSCTNTSSPSTRPIFARRKSK
jgi:hypothetical protein